MMRGSNKPVKKTSTANAAFSYFDKVEVPKHHRERDWSPLIAVLIFLIIIALFGAWIYSLFPHTKSPTANASSKTANSIAVNTETEPPKSYTSTKLNLSFDYPADWTVSDKGSGIITLTSSQTKLVEANGKTNNGLIILIINSQNQLPTGFTAGTAVAVLESQIINFTHPAEGQSGQTYLSFVQYSSTDIKGGMDAVFVTGNNGYQKGQVMPAGDMSNISPLVTVSFNSCEDKKCTQLKPLTIKSSDWNSIKAPLLTILTSLSIQ